MVDSVLPTTFFYLMFMLYLIFSVVLLLNLLIAMMSARYEKKKKDATLKHRIAFGRLVLRFERLVEAFSGLWYRRQQEAPTTLGEVERPANVFGSGSNNNLGTAQGSSSDNFGDVRDTHNSLNSFFDGVRQTFNNIPDMVRTFSPSDTLAFIDRRVSGDGRVSGSGNRDSGVGRGNRPSGRAASRSRAESSRRGSHEPNTAADVEKIARQQQHYITFRSKSASANLLGLSRRNAQTSTAASSNIFEANDASEAADKITLEGEVSAMKERLATPEAFLRERLDPRRESRASPPNSPQLSPDGAAYRPNALSIVSEGSRMSVDTNRSRGSVASIAGTRYERSESAALADSLGHLSWGAFVSHDVWPSRTTPSFFVSYEEWPPAGPPEVIRAAVAEALRAESARRASLGTPETRSIRLPDDFSFDDQFSLDDRFSMSSLPDDQTMDERLSKALPESFSLDDRIRISTIQGRNLDQLARADAAGEAVRARNATTLHTYCASGLPSTLSPHRSLAPTKPGAELGAHRLLSVDTGRPGR